MIKCIKRELKRFFKIILDDNINCRMEMGSFHNEWNVSRNNGVSNPSYNIIRHSHPTGLSNTVRNYEVSL